MADGGADKPDSGGELRGPELARAVLDAAKVRRDTAAKSAGRTGAGSGSDRVAIPAQALIRAIRRCSVTCWRRS